MVRSAAMRTVNLADAKASLSELVATAAAGEIVTITKHGKPVARLTAVDEPREPVALADLQALTDALPQSSEGAGDVVRRMRDGDRY
jgi:prevent-host-death family protein